MWSSETKYASWCIVGVQKHVLDLFELLRMRNAAPLSEREGVDVVDGFAGVLFCSSCIR